MAQLTFQLDPSSEQAIKELKEFFGTKSSAAAVRTALTLARTIAPASKQGTVVIRDQNTNQDLKIVMTR
jgi:hypothetical protein